ncbi:hypothetical protein F5Y11DRAFT_328374 [Daldinia sp. FL1419]|nr:hypothetical protein F5Y11DRAFT_328374 [Daldinia sp. FL1419]
MCMFTLVRILAVRTLAAQQLLGQKTVGLSTDAKDATAANLEITSDKILLKAAEVHKKTSSSIGPTTIIQFTDLNRKKNSQLKTNCYAQTLILIY